MKFPGRQDLPSIEQRRRIILKALLDGMPPGQIVESCVEKWGALSRVTIRNYINDVREQMAADFRLERKALLNQHLAMRQSLYHRALNDGRLDLCHNILCTTEKLLKLDYDLGDHIGEIERAGLVVLDPNAQTEDTSENTIEVEAKEAEDEYATDLFENIEQRPEVDGASPQSS